ncbi:cation:proton antiporter domain-containing protein [Hymenobacter convexus]|uniref:cation:proton antiporter domain-containing protein n=1 Tax=Hymenobacter sp. CA1UV-4 TaxID=3063782 RepID=UPI002712F31B|nr:cation:proton antiporter [Hymenobacter sp. CA1UV-4]MDO7850983.1 cation:proton antiporter [Hymenobacter sp. CA1UV-4]
MNNPLLHDLLIILLLSVGVILLFNRIKLPAIIGYLVTGMLAGPYALGLVNGPHQVDQVAELGVALLMFTIGLEFSVQGLARIKRAVFVGGTLQVGLTVAVVAVLSLAAGSSVGTAVFWGFLLSLSSTAIVLKLMQERMEVDSMHGQIVLAILLFQDLVVVPMMLLIPLLSGQTTGSPWLALGLMLVKIMAVLAAVVLGGRYLMPRLLLAVARTRSRELFLLTIIGTCLGVGWLTDEAGLSMALGAFLAGLIISESEYSYEAVSNVLPFREIFASFFFVSIGMLFDVHVLLDRPVAIVLLTTGVILLKMLLTPMATVNLRAPVGEVLLTGLALAQVGEFSFVLSRAGLQAGLITPDSYQVFLAISVLTMCCTPGVMAGARPLVDWVMRLSWPLRYERHLHRSPAPIVPALPAPATQLSDHLVIVGYGLNGRNLVRAAKFANLTYVILEADADKVHRGLKRGEHIVYGDVTHEHVLEHLGVARARVVVIAISDPAATVRAVATIRRINATGCILVRSLYVYERKNLYHVGATEVIAQEQETSLEMLAHVLTRFVVPLPDIEKLITELRHGSHAMLRPHSMNKAAWSSIHACLAGAELASVEVDTDPQYCFDGETLSERAVRERFDLCLLAIRRNGTMLEPLTTATVIEQHDTLYVFGKPAKVAALEQELHAVAA